jgi:hypothetical protein
LVADSMTPRPFGFVPHIREIGQLVSTLVNLRQLSSTTSAPHPRDFTPVASLPVLRPGVAERVRDPPRELGSFRHFTFGTHIDAHSRTSKRHSHTYSVVKEPSRRSHAMKRDAPQHTGRSCAGSTSGAHRKAGSARKAPKSP